MECFNIDNHSQLEIRFQMLSDVCIFLHITVHAMFTSPFCLEVDIGGHLICNAKRVKYLSHFVYDIYLKKTM